MRFYCTLFDHTYLSRGLALYESLFQYEKEATLFILAMDDLCYNKLETLKLKNVVLIRESEFQNTELRKIKNGRGKGEYCWTCTSFLIEFVLNKYQVGLCTYLDSDIFFFHSPDHIFEAIKGYSVLMTPHNFAEYCDFTKSSGRYCVQFLPFINDESGHEILKDWKQKCIQCCEFIPEKGYCGDQKYLDDWKANFRRVGETEDIGIGVAPWNIDRFELNHKGGQLFIYETKIKKEESLIFYHFHGLKFYDNGVVRVSDPFYKISCDAVKYIYVPYFEKIKEIHWKYHLEEADYDGVEQSKGMDLAHLGKNFYRLSGLLCGEEGRMAHGN